MANESVSQSLPENPDPQVNRVSGDDITHPQEQPRVPDSPPKSLVEWLVRVHLRLLALEQEETKNTG